MKRTSIIVTAAILFTLVVGIWLGHALGSYRAWQAENALATNQMLQIHLLASKGTNPETIAEKAMTLAKTFDSADNGTVSTLNPISLVHSLDPQAAIKLHLQNHKYIASH